MTAESSTNSTGFRLLLKVPKVQTENVLINSFKLVAILVVKLVAKLVTKLVKILVRTFNLKGFSSKYPKFQPEALCFSLPHSVFSKPGNSLQLVVTQLTHYSQNFNKFNNFDSCFQQLGHFLVHRSHKTRIFSCSKQFESIGFCVHLQSYF